MEIELPAIHACNGGLGIFAGDTLRSAATLGDFKRRVKCLVERFHGFHSWPHFS